MKTLKERMQQKEKKQVHGIMPLNKFSIKDIIETEMPNANIEAKASRWNEIIDIEQEFQPYNLPTIEEVYNWKNPYTGKYYE